MPERGRNEELRHELDRVASEVDGGLLSFASPEARQEWVAVRLQWSSAAPGRMNDDDLLVVSQKVLRFSEILQMLKVQALQRDA